MIAEHLEPLLAAHCLHQTLWRGGRTVREGFDARRGCAGRANDSRMTALEQPDGGVRGIERRGRVPEGAFCLGQFRLRPSSFST